MDDVTRRIEPAQAAELHDLAKRTNRLVLVAAVIAAVVWVAAISAAGPELAMPLIVMSGAFGVGVVLVVARPFTKLRNELGLTAAEAQVVIRHERLRRQAP
ncbi:hypothetical protein [Streptomyces sp. V1I1]|uniref:hypothetical protein n=1 Tax=Streptomyces sp. V1I1 TaxID=3042272 RepID=UPI0027883414|nr:hypothetical protein [Streptomyces sp. V1I1]MDQ0946066.1 putative YccA/Bax inhibitor family protein [Streptomyces sp. V1I1]